MNLDRDEIKPAIRAKVIELAKALDMDASDIADDDIIPATGLPRFHRDPRTGRVVRADLRLPAEAGGNQHRQPRVDQRDGGFPSLPETVRREDVRGTHR